MDFGGGNQRSSNQDVNNHGYGNQEFNDMKTAVTGVHLHLEFLWKTPRTSMDVGTLVHMKIV